MGMSESIYDLLDAGKKIYVYNQKVVDSYSRRYNHVGEEERLMMYVNGSLGAYSDAFIMYAIAHMGVATKESIVCLKSERKAAFDCIGKQQGCIVEPDSSAVPGGASFHPYV